MYGGSINMTLFKYIKNILRGKKFRKMAKNSPKRGKSARNGNAPSPYTKYKKRPYIYFWEHKYGVEKEKETYARKKAA